MKGIYAYTALVGPILVWLPVHLWLQAQVHTWWVSRETLARPTLILLWIDNHVVRWCPWVSLGAVLAAPAIAYLVGRGSQASAEAERRTLLRFALVAAATWLGPPVALRADLATYLRVWVLLDLAGTLTFAIALGSVYALQAGRRLGHRAALSPLWTLVVGLLAVMHGEAAALSCLVTYWMWDGWRAGKRAA